MENVIKHHFTLSRSDKEALNGHKGCVLWLTGLSGSGKSTIANKLELALYKKRMQTVVLDGDTIRTGISSDLTFSQADRKENLRRVSEMAKLLAHNGNIVVCCFISPLRSQRELAKKILKEDFLEVYIKADLTVCEARDPKGLYKRARAGEIKNFTGIDSTYEEPAAADLVIESDKSDVDSAVEKLIHLLIDKKIIPNQ